MFNDDETLEALVLVAVCARRLIQGDDKDMGPLNEALVKLYKTDYKEEYLDSYVDELDEG